MTLARPVIATIATAAALLALPAVASAEYFVPPSNSAATQYTETVPTSRGQRDAERERERERSPAEVLGKRNAERLESRGESGRRVAEIVVETAPEPVAAEVVAEERPSGGEAPEPAAKPRRDRDGGAGGNEGGNGTEAGGAAAAGSGGNSGPPGSSGAGAILAEATGLAGSQALWLPLALVLTAAWALAYVARHRQTPSA